MVFDTAPETDDERVCDLAAFYERGHSVAANAFEAASELAQPDDAITFIYTSGTTGPPKGVVLTHANAVAESEALMGVMRLDGQDVTLTFLPLAHVFARAMHWLQLKSGFVCAYAEAITKVVDNMSEIKPTFFPAVPRIYEKIHQAVMAKVEAKHGVGGAYARWALAAAIDCQRVINEQRKRPGLGLRVRCALGPAGAKQNWIFTAGAHGRSSPVLHFRWSSAQS